jgi:hypothetical protein
VLDAGAGGTDAGGGGGDAGTAGPAARAFIDALGSAECAEAYKCEDSFPGDLTQFEQDFGTDRADCVTVEDVFFQGSAAEAEVEAGTLPFSATEAAACLTDLVFGSCDDFWNTDSLPAACGAALAGTATKGEPCVTSWDCTGELVCGSHDTCVTVAD